MAGAACGVHFSDVQPDSGADGVSKRGTAAAADEALEVRAAEARGDRAERGGFDRPHDPLSAAAFRWTGAARHDCAGDCIRPDISPLRRAYWLPGSAEGGR